MLNPTNSILFSVVIPLFNKENYIEDTINSILSQTYKGYEIIIVNDGSTDQSLSIAKSLLHKFKLKTIISQKNKGLSAARNLGISLAKGDIVAFLDADDIWDSDFLETIAMLYQSFPIAEVYGTYYTEYYSKKVRFHPKVTLDKSLKSRRFVIDNFFDVNLGQPIINPSTLACRRSVFSELIFNEAIDFAEDIDFYINCFSKKKLAYAYDAKCNVRINIPNQMTKSNLSGQRIPNFKDFKKNTQNKSLLRYISFMAYTFATKYKYSNDIDNFNRLVEIINFSDLNWKQRLSLKLPRVFYIWIKNTKSFLISKGVKLTTY